jgi:ATP synthase protein I
MVTPSLKSRVRGQAFRIVLWQLAGVIALASLALVLRGLVSAYSVLAGGLAYVLPNLIFVWQVFRFSGAQQMTKFAVAFVVGEMFKLLLSGILFIVIVKTLPVSLLSVLVGFIGAIVSFWIASGVVTK